MYISLVLNGVDGKPHIIGVSATIERAVRLEAKALEVGGDVYRINIEGDWVEGAHLIPPTQANYEPWGSSWTVDFPSERQE